MNIYQILILFLSIQHCSLSWTDWCNDVYFIFIKSRPASKPQLLSLNSIDSMNSMLNTGRPADKWGPSALSLSHVNSHHCILFMEYHYDFVNILVKNLFGQFCQSPESQTISYRKRERDEVWNCSKHYQGTVVWNVCSKFHNVEFPLQLVSANNKLSESFWYLFISCGLWHGCSLCCEDKRNFKVQLKRSCWASVVGITSWQHSPTVFWILNLHELAALILECFQNLWVSLADVSLNLRR